MSDILVLRPQPGAAQTAARAAALGLDAAIAPIFSIQPVAWEPPSPGEIEAVILTSANAARQAGPGLAAFLSLPCYAVGDATAYEARRAGFTGVTAGPRDGEAVIAKAERDGIGRALHLCGREHVEAVSKHLSIVRRIVYSSEALDRLPSEGTDAIAAGALVLIHSPRAGREFARLAESAGIDREQVRLAAISIAAADAAGDGWRAKAVARAPRDEALLELAAGLCKNGAR